MTRTIIFMQNYNLTADVKQKLLILQYYTTFYNNTTNKSPSLPGKDVEYLTQWKLSLISMESVTCR